MPDERESDDSGGAGKGVRFVDTDLSINPSHKAAPDGLQNASADKYYKDVQSIHGDMVRTTVLCVNIPAPSGGPCFATGSIPELILLHVIQDKKMI